MTSNPETTFGDHLHDLTIYTSQYWRGLVGVVPALTVLETLTLVHQFSNQAEDGARFRGEVTASSIWTPYDITPHELLNLAIKHLAMTNSDLHRYLTRVVTGVVPDPYIGEEPSPLTSDLRVYERGCCFLCVDTADVFEIGECPNCGAELCERCDQYVAYERLFRAGVRYQQCESCHEIACGTYQDCHCTPPRDMTKPRRAST